MRARIIVICALSTISAFPLSGCSSGVEPSERDEPLGEAEQAVGTNINLLYEGSCSFLACASSWSTVCDPWFEPNCFLCPNGQYKRANLACGQTCNDNLVYLVSPFPSCGTMYTVCWGGRNVTAQVMDSADSNHNWEASSQLLASLGAPFGTIQAKLYAPSDPGIWSDPACTTSAPPPPPPPPPPPCTSCVYQTCGYDYSCGSPVYCGGCPSGYSCNSYGSCEQSQSCIYFGECGGVIDSCGQYHNLGPCSDPNYDCVQNYCELNQNPGYNCSFGTCQYCNDAESCDEVGCIWESWSQTCFH